MEQQETAKTSKKKPKITSNGAEYHTERDFYPLESLLTNAIPCKSVIFQSTVNSITGEPEYIYYDGGTHRSSRNAKIYCTPNYIILKQSNPKLGEITIIVPSANVKQAIPFT